MPFFAPEQLGPNQSKTPDGFLLCQNVPIARTGTQRYLAGEIDPSVKAGMDGTITVWREAAEVFAPEAIASFEGKPVTILHPAGVVTPDNWGELAVGHAQNVRRGSGEQVDYLVADLLITARRAIDLIRPDDEITRDALTEDEKLSQVSCGYDCDYTQGQPGQAWQLNIRGNHVALVPRGRAGPKCAIQDREPRVEPKPGQKKPSILERARAFVKDLEGENPEEKKPTVDEEMAGVKSDIAELKTTVKDLACVVKDTLEELKKPCATDGTPGVTEPLPVGQAEMGKNPLTGDALRLFAGNLQVLAPGMACTTTDSAPAIENLQRQALSRAMADSVLAAKIAVVTGGRDPNKLTGDALSIVFDASATLARAANVAEQVKPAPRAQGVGTGTGPTTAADVNAANRAFWAAKKG